MPLWRSTHRALHDGTEEEKKLVHSQTEVGRVRDKGWRRECSRKHLSFFIHSWLRKSFMTYFVFKYLKNTHSYILSLFNVTPITWLKKDSYEYCNILSLFIWCMFMKTHICCIFVHQNSSIRCKTIAACSLCTPRGKMKHKEIDRIIFQQTGCCAIFLTCIFIPKTTDLKR